MERFTYRCPKCNGQQIGLDTIAYWNDLTQDFSDLEYNDQNYCRDCGQVGPFKELRLPPVLSETHQLLVLCTAHLTEEVVQDLSNGKLDIEVRTGEYGFLISTVGANVLARLGRLPPCLKRVMDKTGDLGCAYVLFDRDAVPLDDLPIYDW